MIKQYDTICFSQAVNWDLVPVGKIDCFQWESDPSYRPDSSFQMCFLKNKGIYIRLRTDETQIRCVCTKRDESIWEDSCLEFFFSPSDEKGYINVEMNPNGAYLSAVGEGRENRTFLKELTDLPLNVQGSVFKNGWGVDLFISCEVINEAFNMSFNALPGLYKGNFFKCGDKTLIPHFGSFSPMGELPPGFHNPKLFANILVKEEM